jgi:hypothetical protein
MASLASNTQEAPLKEAVFPVVAYYNCRRGESSRSLYLPYSMLGIAESYYFTLAGASKSDFPGVQFDGYGSFAEFTKSF